MIQIYLIPPLQHQELALLGDSLFALAQFVTNKKQEYIDFFRFHNDTYFITIDNGCAEGFRVSSEELLLRANRINADEIICPDVLFDRKKTLELTRQFLSILTKKEKENFQFMAVPHGKNASDYFKNLLELKNIPEINTIGISKFETKHFAPRNAQEIISEGRKNLVKKLYYYILDTNIEFEQKLHLLGGGNVSELEKPFNFIRSNDTCLPFLSAVRGLTYDEESGNLPVRPENPENYFELILDKDSMIRALKNIAVMHKFSKR